ncbi:hypothetical protein [Qipengyuania vesicularis]|nr:hypothetical protein [Qipengyuania vesicularis]
MYVKTENPIQLKMKLALASTICAMATISSAVAMVVTQVNVA